MSKRKITNTDQRIAIRRPGPGELINRTGNVESNHCVIVEERVQMSSLLGHRYMPVQEPALSLLPGWTTLVHFHEAQSEDGDNFAIPQPVEEHPSTPKSWQKSEKEMFFHPIQVWISLEYGEEPGEHFSHITYDKACSPSNGTAFRSRLDKALAADVIEAVDHPVAQKLRAIFGNVEPNDPQLWVEVA